MIKISINNGINTSFSINFLNISFNWNKKEKELNKEKQIDAIGDSENIELLTPKYKDYKTPFGGWEIEKVSEITSDVNVYLFIEKDKGNSSEWNLVVPVIHEKETNKIYQYKLGNFALQGCGGGLRNTTCLINALKQLSKKEIQVNFIPRVIDNQSIHGFEYVDSGITLSYLIEKSTDLGLYRKDSFERIYKKYNEIINKDLVYN